MIYLREDWLPNRSVIYPSRLSCHVAVMGTVMNIGHPPQDTVEPVTSTIPPSAYTSLNAVIFPKTVPASVGDVHPNSLGGGIAASDLRGTLCFQSSKG